MPLESITYVSSAKKLFEAEELTALLFKSRDNNQKFGITGLLLYQGGSFMQTIEGPAESVQQLYKNIRADATHHSVITLLDEPITDRIFPEWHMGFLTEKDPELRKLPGYSSFLIDQLEAEHYQSHPSEAMQLLFGFRQAIR